MQRATIGTMRNFLIWAWILSPGCWALTGPEEASGPLGGSLSVQCQYKERYQKYKKYWCRGIFLFSCSIVIQTEGSEEKLAGNRVSIHDNHTQSTFTVTMESLAWNDTDTYWCGIDRPGFDSMINVNVLVFSDTTTPLLPMTTAAEEEKSTPPSSNITEVDAGIPNLIFYIVTPVIVLVLLLILFVAVRCRRTSQRRRKALEETPGKRDENGHTYNTNPGHTRPFIPSETAETDQMAIYMNKPPPPSSAEQDSEYENMQLRSQVSGGRKASSDPEDCSATDQREVYINMCPIRQSPPLYSQAKCKGKS
nr:CMRF35-like molecule 7 [Pelodiscus sinensis]|eukprot:XP_025046095.1 CMRF35-like molecule 7 [Pelodiscus sinensis]